SAVGAAAEAVRRSGKARVGDKTMVDALEPFASAFARGASGGGTFRHVWTTAAAAAESGAEETAALLPQLGRARAHGRKSLGSPDPGAVSFALIATAVAHQIS